MQSGTLFPVNDKNKMEGDEERKTYQNEPVPFIMKGCRKPFHFLTTLHEFSWL